MLTYNVMIYEYLIYFLFTVHKHRRVQNAETGMASLFYLFFYATEPYEEVSYRCLRGVFPTFFWRLRKRGRSHLDFAFRFLRNWALGKYTWLGTYLLVLILILVLKRYVRTDERIINTMERNARRLLDLIHWRIFWSGISYHRINERRHFHAKAKSSRHT